MAILSWESEQQRGKWTVLMATIWIQAFTGTNLDFSAYSSGLKSVLGISQLKLNYLAVASDIGKAFGWSSGLALLYLPLWSVLLLACAMGLVGYILQWLLLDGALSIPYYAVFFLCLVAGCSICWFNTICSVLCIGNFPPSSRPLALSLSASFNGISAALYTLMATATSSHPSIYLLLNATIPLFTSLLALLPILHQPPFTFLVPPLPSSSSLKQHDFHIFLVLNVFAFITGLYILFVNSTFPTSSTHTMVLIFLSIAVLLLLLPLFVPIILSQRNLQPKATPSHNDDDDPRKSLLVDYVDRDDHGFATLGEEHTPGQLIRRIEFWLYYASYFCGATVCLVYGNNLGQIAQSLGREQETTKLVSVFSACSFFGRLISSLPDFLNKKFHFPRTGWLVVALIPMPLTFFLLAGFDDGYSLVGATVILGLSSGFVLAAAVSVTYELFGPNSVGFNHNILITNIPIGSLLHGFLAALVYDGASGGNFSTAETLSGDGSGMVCMGKQCYAATFIVWGCTTLLGLASGVSLFLRTRVAYSRWDPEITHVTSMLK